MGIPLSDDIKTLVRGANFAHLATLMPDGSPQAAPVWVDLEGDRILVGTSEGSLKAKNAKRDARVALSLVAYDNPYVEAQLRGRVAERWTDYRLQDHGPYFPQVHPQGIPHAGQSGQARGARDRDRARALRQASFHPHPGLTWVAARP